MRQDPATKHDAPIFAAWERHTLDRFATESYHHLRALMEANEQLRLDLKDAMRLTRKQYTDNAT